ncbi:MAG: xanthine dehydrogenase family protein molybdopterin-binding subunit [Acidimicrobiales bacterium]
MTGPLIGTRVLRVEDPALLKGQSTFVANLDLEGALVAHYVLSIEAHALIVGIETDEARAMPGVVDIITAADLEADEIDFGPIPGTPPGFPDGTSRGTLATDRVRFVGEPIVAIVAETAEQAADAAEAVIVDYDPLPVVVDPAGAADNETLLFPEAGTNVMMTASGGVEEPPDFSACEVVVEIEMTNNRVAPCPIETRVAASMWTEDGRLLHYAACQGVHPIQKGLAAFYGLDTSEVRVVTADVGGSFGAKSRLYPEDILLPFLAKRAGRPVRWSPNRSDDMNGLGHSRAQLQRIKIGGRRDGKIEAMQTDVTGDCGAYPVGAPALMRNAGLVLPGPLNVSNVHWTGRVVVTNTTPTVAYRGAGRPEGGAMLNRGIDAFAAEIGMDPLDVRRVNLLEVEDLPWLNPTGLTYDSGDYRTGLELAASEIDHDAVRARQAEERAAGATTLTGLGYATFIDRTAGLKSDDYGSIELRPDGTFYVLTSSSPYGQGHYTSWAMLVADRTGVPLSDIEVFHGDTDVVPKGGITGGSRSTQRAGSAVAEAADGLVVDARSLAADLLEASVDDVVLDLDTATFHVAGAPGAATVGWREVAAGWAEARQRAGEDDYALACESHFDGDGPSVPSGMYAALVSVDTETGAVTLDRMVSVDDAGTVLNPMLVEGQLHGGIAQGIGQAMFEEFRYDENGNPITGSFLDYGVPSAAEMPMFEVHLMEIPSPNNPLGFKGIAESGCIGATPAIQNAVVDALSHLGVRHIEMPVTPQRVWEKIDQHS